MEIQVADSGSRSLQHSGDRGCAALASSGVCNISLSNSAVNETLVTTAGTGRTHYARKTDWVISQSEKNEMTASV